MFLNRSQNNNSSNSNNRGTSPGSWEEFSRKLYFYRDTREDASEDSRPANPTDNRRRPFSKIWIYVGVAITYLFVIGIVAIVLIFLIPKYPSHAYGPPFSTAEMPILVPINKPIHNLSPYPEQNGIHQGQHPPNNVYKPMDEVLHYIDPRSGSGSNHT